MPYGVMEHGQHWFRQWLVAWWHQAITWTNVDWSSVRSGGIHQRAIFQEIHKIWYEFENYDLRLHLHLPGAIELNDSHDLVSTYTPYLVHWLNKWPLNISQPNYLSCQEPHLPNFWFQSCPTFYGDCCQIKYVYATWWGYISEHTNHPLDRLRGKKTSNLHWIATISIDLLPNMEPLKCLMRAFNLISTDNNEGYGHTHYPENGYIDMIGHKPTQGHFFQAEELSWVFKHGKL